MQWNQWRRHLRAPSGAQNFDNVLNMECLPEEENFEVFYEQKKFTHSLFERILLID